MMSWITLLLTAAFAAGNVVTPAFAATGVAASAADPLVRVLHLDPFDVSRRPSTRMPTALFIFGKNNIGQMQKSNHHNAKINIIETQTPTIRSPKTQLGFSMISSSLDGNRNRSRGRPPLWSVNHIFFGLTSKLALFAEDFGQGGMSSISDDSTILTEPELIRILRAIPRHNNNKIISNKIENADKKNSSTSKIQIRSCDTAQDVLLLLLRATSSIPRYSNIESTTTWEVHEIKSLAQKVVEGTSPNIAAAALRRLLEPPFLVSSSCSDVCDTERETYSLLLTLLLKKLNSSMVHQVKMISSYSFPSSPIATDKMEDDGKNRSPAMRLLPHSESLLTPPTSSSSSTMNDAEELLNWYALADVLFSLSKLSTTLSRHHQRAGQRSRVSTTKNKYIQTIITSCQDQNCVSLLSDSILRYLSWNDQVTSSFVRCIGPRRVVRDVLHPLEVLMASETNTASNSGRNKQQRVIGAIDGGDNTHYYNPLLAIVSHYLMLPHALSKLTASDLSTTLYSLAKIYCYPVLQSTSMLPHLQSPQRTLLRAVMKRLRKYSIRSSAHGTDLVKAIWSVGQLLDTLTENDVSSRTSGLDVSLFDQHTYMPFSIDGLDDRIRFPGEEDIVSASGNTAASFFSQLQTQSSEATPEKSMPAHENKTPTSFEDDSLNIPTKTLQNEVVIMFHTLTNEIILPPRHFKDGGGNSRNDNKLKLHSLTLGQVSDILQTAMSLKISHEDLSNTITEIAMYLTSSSQRSVLKRCHDCKDISRILRSLQRLRVGTKDVDCDDVRLEESCVKMLGERFLEIVLWNHGENSPQPQHRHPKRRWACDPKTLNNILRSGVMMFPGNSAATKAMLDAASVLILEGDNYNMDKSYNNIVTFDDDFFSSSSSSFLSNCNEYELSNYLWVFAMARRFDKEVFVSLTDQMLDYDIEESSTASRVMWSSAMLLSLNDTDTTSSRNYGDDSHSAFLDNQYYSPTSDDSIDFFHERQVDLFHHLGGVLFSSQLSPIDASCAMWAMAKTSYAIDRGIFDFLAESLATKEMLEASNTRHISQALWACGKMVAFEDPMMTDMAVVQGTNDNADNTENTENWELEETKEQPMLNPPPYMKGVDKFLEFLILNQDQMTPKHTAQTIWAIGRLRISDYDKLVKIGAIALRIAPRCNAQEIANIVWGLSKVGYPNQWVVSKLIEQITSSPKLASDCTCQEAANALYALGRLQIRDPHAFSSLSSIMLNRMQEATSQAIANALWAHEVVDLEPPRELLDCWARDNLGLVAAIGMRSPDSE